MRKQTGVEITKSNIIGIKQKKLVIFFILFQFEIKQKIMNVIIKTKIAATTQTHTHTHKRIYIYIYIYLFTEIVCC